MKKIFLLILLVTHAAFAQQNLNTHYAELITAADLKDNLSIIASDALEGRYTGSRGQKMAAAFISDFFENTGLAGPVNGSYYMPVELTLIKPADIYLKSGAIRFTNFNEVVFIGPSGKGGEISLDAVFVGKGTEADLAYVDVKDKAVVILAEGFSFSAFRGIQKKAEAFRAKGAKMILATANEKSEEFKSFANRLKDNFGNGTLQLKKPAGNESEGMFFIDPSAVAKRC